MARSRPPACFNSLPSPKNTKNHPHDSELTHIMVELLEPIVPEATTKWPKCAMGRMADFTPEELADLPFSLDLCFTREELDEARRYAVA